MLAVMKPLGSLCAADLMSSDVVMISDQMSLQGAAGILSRAQVSGAPVIDGEGRLIGILSAVDFLHWAEEGHVPKAPCECSDSWESWQMLDDDKHAETRVGDVMTRDPVTATLKTPIGELSRMMLDAHIHRIVVMDGGGKPVGVVTSTDILAAVGRSENVESRFS